MLNKRPILAVIAGLVIAAGIICWLYFSGSVPAKEELAKNFAPAANATVKDSIISREQDGHKLWQFHVDEIENVKSKNRAFFKGIKGQIYRDDGSVLDVEAEKGSMVIGKNDFTLQGKVKAVLSTGGVLTADRVDYQEKKQIVRARGHVDIRMEGWHGKGDFAETTTALKQMKMKGHAKVEKGGDTL